jgi:hypothetical protein
MENKRGVAMEAMNKSNPVVDTGAKIFASVCAAACGVIPITMGGGSRRRKPNLRVVGGITKPRITTRICFKGTKCQATGNPKFTGKRTMCDTCHEEKEQERLTKRARK